MISDISYLIIYNSHNGHSIKIPKPIRFHNLRDFRRFISGSLLSTDSSDDNLFLLTSFGIKLNFNLINDINEVFVYDKRLFVDDVDFTIFDQFTGDAQQQPQGIPTIPAATKTSSVREMTNHLKVLHNWSRSVMQDVQHLTELNSNLIKSINTIFKSLNVIFQFMNNFISEIEVSFNNYFNYIKLIQFKTLHKSWETHYKKLLAFPMVKIGNKNIKLNEFIEFAKLKQYSGYIGKYLPLIITKFNSLNSTIKTVHEQDKFTIDKYIEQLRNNSIDQFKHSNTDIKNLEKYADTIANDIDRLSHDSRQLDKVYQSHTEEYSVNLYQGASQIYNRYQDLYKFKSKLARYCLNVFNNIAKVQMNMVNVKTELKHLTNDEEPEKQEGEISIQVINTVKKYEDYLSLTIDLPLLFGFILIEKRRQFEWFDFYSKGIVNNLSEQLSTIINHEKLFRTIWIKKFGNFLKLLSQTEDNTQFNIVLPNIDITLLSNKDKANPFAILDDIQIDRNDIVNYISTVETSGLASFVELLNKNYKDLIQSTNNLKKITKLITSLSNYTSISNQDRSKLEVDGSEVDFDLSLIKGLKSRIKKLENLLHQQQVKNLNNWPTNGTPARTNTNGRVAVSGSVMLLDQKKTGNPTQLLERSGSITNTTANGTVVSPASIDKHLDNIRLKKVNNELSLQVDELTQKNNEKDALIAKLTEEIKNLTNNSQTVKQEASSKDHQIETLAETVKSQTEQIKSLTDSVEKHKQESSEEILSLNKIISNLRTELTDANHIKNELLSNLASKETEFTKERTQFDQDLKKIQHQLENTQEDYENLMELTQIRQSKYDSGLDTMNEIMTSWIKRLLGLVFNYIIEYCLILESMGLLLVKDGDKFVIKRVKGLRSKNESHDVPSSEAIDEVMSKMKFIEDMTMPITEKSDDDEMSKYKSIIAPFQDNANNFKEFIELLSFKDNVTLHEDATSTKFFLNSISKRFKDVEGFAKRQTKENKLNQTEIKKLLFKLRTKISMTGFSEDDLLLFLPTRIERAEADHDENTVRPWAAFNIGAPHYFLNVKDENDVKDRDWIIARVKKITEFKVTEDTFDNIDINPFRLSVGVVWYLVDVDEEK
ncbi:uncharacterized protein SPAPADRAFT_72690 [Spathaspora passalidarum NRRL Y-27907]|uniref:Autophagy-related protein 11 n=1 Tax=Spathaspora passalidarum (strain NRRL Y-27907 / 11-Y1) TaxID=619300 RepID=G3ASX7_SPAPN|nr:uncharacterized protein SPAPADRAFT_72690 [Spathaspora passalidarum NRRL Y-27907]EGW30759.1 hypothetical protein SPAPADRAFT_72690 [Spathaspora passalidarum NRRL Y-27907]